MVGQHGWKLSSRFEGALRQLGDKCVGYRNTKSGSEEEDLTLVELMDARRDSGGGRKQLFAFGLIFHLLATTFCARR